jgi:hypothetical protein
MDRSELLHGTEILTSLQETVSNAEANEISVTIDAITNLA